MFGSPIPLFPLPCAFLYRIHSQRTYVALFVWTVINIATSSCIGKEANIDRVDIEELLPA